MTQNTARSYEVNARTVQLLQR